MVTSIVNVFTITIDQVETSYKNNNTNPIFFYGSK